MKKSHFLLLIAIVLCLGYAFRQGVDVRAQTDGYFQGNDAFLPTPWEGSIVLEASAEIVAVMREDTSSTTAGYNGVSR